MASCKPANKEIVRMATRPMPCLSLSAGNGNANTNIVMTGEINDMGQLTACENHNDTAVPKANLRMRTLAMFTTRPLS